VDNDYLIAGLWMGLAFLASLVSIRVGISVALIEIGLGVIGGNVLGVHTTPWIDFPAAFGAVLLTLLAGAEIDPRSLRPHLRASLIIGAISLAAPFGTAFAVAATASPMGGDDVSPCGPTSRRRNRRMAEHGERLALDA
jgi:Kef-type K+ transport system membrane component KefB